MSVGVMKDYKLKQRVYYESIKREPKIRGIKKCRCDERLQTKTKEFTRLPYTGLVYKTKKFTRLPWYASHNFLFSFLFGN
jgi:hypothetical protein